jgi:hypothetical protein
MKGMSLTITFESITTIGEKAENILRKMKVLRIPNTTLMHIIAFEAQ